MLLRTVLTLALLLVASCGGDDRFIPEGDPDFADLEQPEQDGECTADGDCYDSCLHRCVVDTGGPTTCPADPPPRPERLVGATCACDSDLGDVCAWSAP